MVRCWLTMGSAYAAEFLWGRTSIVLFYHAFSSNLSQATERTSNARQPSIVSCHSIHILDPGTYNLGHFTPRIRQIHKNKNKSSA